MTTHCTHVEFTCHFTPPSPRHDIGTENEIHSQTMSSSQEVNYATINVSPLSPSPPLQVLSLNSMWKFPGTLQDFASVPTDHPSLTVTLPRLHPPHSHLRSRLLLFNVSPPLHTPILNLTLSPVYRKGRSTNQQSQSSQAYLAVSEQWQCSALSEYTCRNTNLFQNTLIAVQYQ